MKHTLKNNKSKLIKNIKNIKKKLTINNKSKSKRFIYNYNNNKVNYYKHINNYKYMSGGSNIINFIKVLEQLSKIVKNKGNKEDIFKVAAYNKAINELKKYTALPNSVEITSAQELKKLKLPRIGEKIINKFDEFLTTGTLEEVEKEKNNPVNTFANIYGIGPVKAKELVELKNISTLEELELRQNELQENKLPLLNSKQQIGLKYYNDLLKRIPREEIEEFKIVLETNFKETLAENNEAQKNHKFEIVGSYRRNKPESGDIDLIFTSYNNNKIVFENFIKKLQSKKILLEILSKGETKSLTIGKLPKATSTSRRIDFLYTPPEEYPFAILYFTGSKEFNTAMRQHALNVDLTLSEHGFYKLLKKSNQTKDTKDTKIKQIKQEKVVDVLFKTEKDIFNFLHMEYKEPQDRINENSIILTLPLEEIKKKIEEPQPLIQEPPVQEPPVQEPLIQEPPVQEPLIQEPPVQEPLIQEPLIQEPLIQEPQKKPKKKETIKIKIPKATAKTLKKYTKKIKSEILENLNKFKTQGISSLEMLSLEELTAMLQEAIDNYYISDLKENSLLTDNEYDILREHILKKDPTNALANDQQTQIADNTSKVKLPYEMWSMDKIKPDTNALTKFKEKFKGPYVISAKVDGVSALYSTESGTPNLYKKGDGKYGFLINHIIPYLKLPTEKNITLRGELIIKEETFEKKYKDKFANSRNFISGIVNRKKLTQAEKEILKDIDFVAYEVIMPQNLKPSEQYNKLVELNTIAVKNIQSITYSELTNEYLSNKLLDFRANYEYTIDGIICIDDNIHPRESKNPEHAFAFKMVLTDQVLEAKVLDVLWSASKDGLLKPRVQFEPVQIGGVTITYATGINARFIVDNNIGLGALVRLTRSGNVIPKITEVIVPAQKPIMPNVDEYDYIWNETNVDLILVNVKADPRVAIKSIAKFFKELEVDGLGEANIEKIIASGANSIPKIINATPEDLMKVEGFKEKMATKIHTSIAKQLAKASIAKIAGASNIFGRGLGEKSVSQILKAEPNILTSQESSQEKITKVKAIEGFAEKTATQFVNAIPEFNKFLISIKPQAQEADKEEPKEEPKEDKKEDKEEDKEKEEPLQEHVLNKKIIVFSDFEKSSKYTKKELENLLLKYGVQIEGNITKNTNILVTGNNSSKSTKTEKAKKIGTIEIITLDDFLEKYVNTSTKSASAKNTGEESASIKTNIYILKLEKEKYYIGTTNNKYFTLQSYLNNNTAAWTRKYKPLKVIRFIEDCYIYEENIVTLNLMKLYGVANVRGGSYDKVILDKSTLNTIAQKLEQ
jgi:DNA ligase (NAD+)